MINSLKKGIIFSLSFWVFFVIFGITYAALSTLNSGDILTSSTWNEVVSRIKGDNSEIISSGVLANGMNCPTSNTSYPYDTFITCYGGGGSSSNGCLYEVYINDEKKGYIGSGHDTANFCIPSSWSFFLPANTNIRFVGGLGGWGNFANSSYTVVRIGKN